jgi:hypothetical protein
MRRWRHDRHESQVEKALRNGETRQSKTNTRVTFEGKCERIQTFEGSRWFAAGRMEFWHWRARVLAVDFNRDMVTDFGYTGFSVSTNSNISGWLEQLQRMGFLGMRSFEPFVWPLDWTVSGRYNSRSPARLKDDLSHSECLRAVFHMGAPWVKQVDGDPWFHGPSYDAAVVENAENVFEEISKDGLGWRWFTADWVNGLWTKRFIDEGAEKRWKKWRAKREKAA